MRKRIAIILAFCLMLPALILFSACGNNASNNVEVDEFINIANQTTTVLKTRCARDASQSLTMGRDTLQNESGVKSNLGADDSLFNSVQLQDIFNKVNAQADKTRIWNIDGSINSMLTTGTFVPSILGDLVKNNKKDSKFYGLSIKTGEGENISYYTVETNDNHKIVYYFSEYYRDFKSIRLYYVFDILFESENDFVLTSYSVEKDSETITGWAVAQCDSEDNYIYISKRESDNIFSSTVSNGDMSYRFDCELNSNNELISYCNDIVNPKINDIDFQKIDGLKNRVDYSFSSQEVEELYEKYTINVQTINPPFVIIDDGENGVISAVNSNYNENYVRLYDSVSLNILGMNFMDSIQTIRIPSSIIKLKARGEDIKQYAEEKLRYIEQDISAISMQNENYQSEIDRNNQEIEYYQNLKEQETEQSFIEALNQQINSLQKQVQDLQEKINKNNEKSSNLQSSKEFYNNFATKMNSNRYYDAPVGLILRSFDINVSQILFDEDNQIFKEIDGNIYLHLKNTYNEPTYEQEDDYYYQINNPEVLPESVTIYNYSSLDEYFHKFCRKQREELQEENIYIKECVDTCPNFVPKSLELLTLNSYNYILGYNIKKVVINADRDFIVYIDSSEVSIDELVINNKASNINIQIISTLSEGKTTINKITFTNPYKVESLLLEKINLLNELNVPNNSNKIEVKNCEFNFQVELLNLDSFIAYNSKFNQNVNLGIQFFGVETATFEKDLNITLNISKESNRHGVEIIREDFVVKQTLSISILGAEVDNLDISYQTSNKIADKIILTYNLSVTSLTNWVKKIRLDDVNDITYYQASCVKFYEFALISASNFEVRGSDLGADLINFNSNGTSYTYSVPQTQTQIDLSSIIGFDSQYTNYFSFVDNDAYENRLESSIINLTENSTVVYLIVAKNDFSEMVSYELIINRAKLATIQFVDINGTSILPNDNALCGTVYSLKNLKASKEGYLFWGFVEYTDDNVSLAKQCETIGSCSGFFSKLTNIMIEDDTKFLAIFVECPIFKIIYSDNLKTGHEIAQSKTIVITEELYNQHILYLDDYIEQLDGYTYQSDFYKLPSDSDYTNGSGYLPLTYIGEFSGYTVMLYYEKNA